MPAALHLEGSNDSDLPSGVTNTQYEQTQYTPQPYLNTKTHVLCSFTDPVHLITSTQSVSPSEGYRSVKLITITSSLITLTTAFTSLMSEGLLSKTCKTIPPGQMRPRTHTFPHAAAENGIISVILITNCPFNITDVWFVALKH